MNEILKESLKLFSENILSFIIPVKSGDNKHNPERINNIVNRYKETLTFNNKSILLIGEGKTNIISYKLSTPNNILISIDLFRKINSYIVCNNHILPIPLSGNINKLPKEYNNKFDYVISNGVFEHLVNPKKALRKMFNALKINGVMVHYIDTRHHNIFNGNWNIINKFPLVIWKLLTFRNGKINRLQYDDYVKLFNKYNWQSIQISERENGLISIRVVK